MSQFQENRRENGRLEGQNQIHKIFVARAGGPIRINILDKLLFSEWNSCFDHKEKTFAEKWIQIFLTLIFGVQFVQNVRIF